LTNVISQYGEYFKEGTEHSQQVTELIRAAYGKFYTEPAKTSSITTVKKTGKS